MTDRTVVALHLRTECGLSISDIAERLDLSRSVAGEMVKGIDPLPHALLTEEAPDPDRERLLKLRRSCGACLAVKPWTEFWAAAKYPDGTMQRPQSHCKDCVKAARRRRRREDPEWARAQYKADWQRIKANPDQLAKRRELTRENSRVHRLRAKEAA